MWRSFGLDVLEEDVRSVQLDKGSKPTDGAMKMTVVSRLAPPCLAWGFRVTTTYTLRDDSTLTVRVVMEPQGPIPESLPRVGLEMNLPTEFTKVAWCGRGPGQSYRDSCRGAKIGIYEAHIDEMMTQYEVPQENGNRTNTRWVQVVNAQGVGLQAEVRDLLESPPTSAAGHGGRKGFDFAVQRHTSDQLAKAKHPHELPKSDAVILRLDVAHHGLGSGSCGPKTWGEHVLKTQAFDFEVRLKYVQSKVSSR